MASSKKSSAKKSSKKSTSKKSGAKKSGAKKSGAAAKRRPKKGAKTDAKGKTTADQLPSTLQRSPAKAQRTFAETHDAALAGDEGNEQRAHRIAFAALKHSFEKVGDHWEAKAEKGPSDQQAEGGLDTNRPTAGGVDANASKAHLMDVAKKLDIKGRSLMKKDQLVEAIGKANNRESARSLKRDRAKKGK